MARWLLVAAVVVGLSLRHRDSTAVLQPGCEAAEANAKAGLDACIVATAKFEGERDEYVSMLNKTLTELSASLDYWQKLSSGVADDFRTNPNLDPHMLMAVPQSLSGCDEVQRIHLRIQQCESLLATAQVYARKTILGMEQRIRDGNARLDGYKMLVKRMRSENSGARWGSFLNMAAASTYWGGVMESMLSKHD